MALNSVSGLLSLLNDTDARVQEYSLRRLLELVDVFWPEISDSVNKVEMLYENNHNKLAALLVSKVYYHLSAYKDSLNFALCAEELFDLNQPNDFVETIVAKCIDSYTEMRCKMPVNGTVLNFSSNETQLYNRLQGVVQRMFNRSLEKRELKNALGIALETKRLDMVERILDEAGPEEANDLLRMAYRVTLSTVSDMYYRQRLLYLLAKLHVTQRGNASVLDLFNCLIALFDSEGCAILYEALLHSDTDHLVVAYQAAFDMLELGNQGFCAHILQHLHQRSTISALFVTDEEKLQRAQLYVVGPAAGGEMGDLGVSQPTDDAMETNESSLSIEEMGSVMRELLQWQSASSGGSKDSDSLSLTIERPLLRLHGVSVDVELSQDDLRSRLNTLTSILNGDKKTELIMQFLIRNNRTDMRLLDRMKAEVRQSITHNATVIANSLVHFGTTSDQFLRDNLEWLARSVNWAKFTATSSLGVIHRGHETEALNLMEAYLPRDAGGVGGSPYTEGGGLYALGLLHAGHGRNIRGYLLQQLRDATTEQVRHGALLGLGLACMCTVKDDRSDVFKAMRDMLMNDEAAIGEAAAIGIGLASMGSLNTAVFNTVANYAKDTKHDKIIRGCAMATALMCFGHQSAADDKISMLCADKNASIRTGGAAAIGMAYCGTSNAQAVRKLLHMAVSDTSDDVKRWVVTSLGFVLCNTPERVPAVVNLLAESYNPHLRYGSAMAVAIACAGTGMKEAIALIEPLLEDRTHYVRQGAFIAMAMVTMQHNEVTCNKAITLRDKLLKVIADKHDDVMAKFGAMIAVGIQNAGGRNVTISLQNRSGGINWMAAAGLLLFQNHWHWYPLTHTISLAFVPTAVMVLNKELQMPKVNFVCHSKPSTFAYVPPLREESEKKHDKHETVVLSVTAKELRRAERKKAGGAGGSAQDKNRPKSSGLSATPKPSTSTEVKADDKEEKTETKPVEPNFTILSNPARVLPMQAHLVQLASPSAAATSASQETTDEAATSATPSTNPQEQRYRPARPLSSGGIILLHDSRPSDTQELVELMAANRPQGSAAEDTGPEPEPPEPFLWTAEDEAESQNAFQNRNSGK